MTYTRARLIIWNSGAYSRPQVEAAAVFILGSLNARNEDIAQAAIVL